MAEYVSFLERKKQEKQKYTTVLQFLSQSWYIIHDVSEEPQYFQDDIDVFFWDETKEKLFSWEIKIDFKIGSTWNFFLETFSNKHKWTPGCFLYSKADLYIYYDVLRENIYIFHFETLKQWFLKSTWFDWIQVTLNEKYFKTKETHTQRENGGFSHTTVGVIVKDTILERSLKQNKIPFIKKKINENISQSEIQNLMI